MRKIVENVLDGESVLFPRRIIVLDTLIEASTVFPRDILYKPASRILDVRQRRISNIAIKGKYKEQKNKLQYRFTSVKNE